MTMVSSIKSTQPFQQRESFIYDDIIAFVLIIKA